MADKVLWTGLTIIVVNPIFPTAYNQPLLVAGAIIMVLGLIPKWMDK